MKKFVENFPKSKKPVEGFVKVKGKLVKKYWHFTQNLLL
jgi:hypothetical protein